MQYGRFSSQQPMMGAPMQTQRPQMAQPGGGGFAQSGNMRDQIARAMGGARGQLMMNRQQPMQQQPAQGTIPQAPQRQFSY